MIVYKISFAVYVFINSSCYKKSYFSWNLPHLSKETPQTKYERLSISNSDLSERLENKLSSKSNFGTFLQIRRSNFRLKLF